MESEEKENGNQSFDELTADLSKRSLKKIEKATNEHKVATCLILDRNELQRLDNLDMFVNVRKLSLSCNRLIRMDGVSCMVNLSVLDISNNNLVCIEGLKDLKQLKHLNLSWNKIKTVDHLNHNLLLEYLDLSQNIIGHISDISFLEKLKELFLHNNEIAHLRQCEKNLPNNLETLTLNNNCITDLNEISHLVVLRTLKELTFNGNPCLEFTDGRIDFNYRPFVKNWCSSIITLDGYPLDDIECLKAEWLYSQGRGRSFRPGEHLALARYLTGVCPRTTEPNVESEDEKKLRLILSKAQHHQQQLKEELTGSPLLLNRNKLPQNKKKSMATAERMVSSYHDVTSKEPVRGIPDVMTRSLDGVIIRNPQSELPESYRSPLQTATTLLPVPESLTSPDVCRPIHNFPGSNLKTSFPLATSNSSVPSSRSSNFSPRDLKIKSPGVLRKQNNSSPIAVRKCDGLMSPNRSRSMTAKGVSPKKKASPVPTAILRRPMTNGRESSEGDSEFSVKSQKQNQNNALNFEEKENLRNGKDVKDSDVWKAALCIQKYWRGYRTRNLNQKVVDAYRNIQTSRIQDYIIKVANDMEATKVTLEGHRKLQVLQMRAINALWKKMVTLQPGEESISASDNKNTLQDLAETCLNLNRQVEELQNMMKIMHHSTQLVPTGTQTDIVAVHTPQDAEKETFPYSSRPERPSELPVVEQSSESVQQFASSLITDVIKTVSSASEPNSETGDSDAKVYISSDSREESVCLTPACQEGKDLQCLEKINSIDQRTVDSTSGKEEPRMIQNSFKDLDEYHQNGCSFT